MSDDATRAGTGCSVLPVGTAASTDALPRPALMVVVDTEEEFNWNAPFDRSNRSVGHMASIERLQQVCERHGVRPTYVIDHPIADDPVGYEPVRRLVEDGRAVLGAHLHPWVTPPFDEPVDGFHSYHGNLAPELEDAKLDALVQRIEESIGQRPRIFKAGRSGLGAHTFEALQRLGFTVDVSPAPPMDYRSDGGPDYSSFDVSPFWCGELLCMPGSGAFVGMLSGLAPATLQRLIDQPVALTLKLGGILSRLGCISRLRLTPEGFSLDEMVSLSRALLHRGQRMLHVSVHSPSVVAGNTPYARSEAECDALLDRLDRYLAIAVGDLGAVGSDPLSVRSQLLATR